eukprot:184692-Amphidinium_carterae.2
MAVSAELLMANLLLSWAKRRTSIISRSAASHLLIGGRECGPSTVNLWRACARTNHVGHHIPLFFPTPPNGNRNPKVVQHQSVNVPIEYQTINITGRLCT